MPFSGARRRYGFTLVELMVAMFILAVLMTVALPLFVSAVDDSEVKACRANQQSIADAVQAKRVREIASNYSAAIAGGVAVLRPDLGTVVCPEGGEYSIGNGSSGDSGSFKVSCSVAVHGTFEPGH